jgi:hypothetical protein
MKLAAAGAALGLAALLLAHPGSHAAAAPEPGQPRSAGPMDVYFHADAVGRNMRALAVSSCGTERWPVKTLTDYDRAQVRLHPDDVSIKFLRGRATPETLPQANRAGPVERHTYRVHAHLVDYVREADGDYHLVLEGKGGRTIVAEIPSPACVGGISPVKRASRIAREHMDTHYGVTTSFKATDRRVIVKGVGFFDYLHGQTGMAPNGLELHPVTGLRFPR